MKVIALVYTGTFNSMGQGTNEIDDVLSLLVTGMYRRLSSLFYTKIAGEAKALGLDHTAGWLQNFLLL